TGQAREEELPPVLAFKGGAKPVRHLEPSLVIDARRRIAPKHATLLHFDPHFSTEIVGEPMCVVNAKCRASVSYAKYSPFHRHHQPLHMCSGVKPPRP